MTKMDELGSKQPDFFPESLQFGFKILSLSNEINLKRFKISGVASVYVILW